MPVGKLNLPFGHPDNPLGTRWLAWHRGEENTSYGIHGTNDPTGIGGEVSNGCIRMLNPEVEVLFDILPLGAEVRVQP
jgi:lipoprotein-anchoring transpeptidase ErfK/SrfK